MHAVQFNQRKPGRSYDQTEKRDGREIPYQHIKQGDEHESGIDATTVPSAGWRNISRHSASNHNPPDGKGVGGVTRPNRRSRR